MEAAQMKQDGKAQRVVVTGCLAQRYSGELAGEDLIVLVERVYSWLYFQMQILVCEAGP